MSSGYIDLPVQGGGGGGGGSGTVTSVNLASLTPIFTTSGGPVTTVGILQIDLAAQTGNTVLASPSGGGSGVPTFRSLVAADIPSLFASKISNFQTTVSVNTDVAANTAARHDAVTLGTANGLSLSTQQLSLGLSSTSTTGALSSTDWNTFNSKQPTITTGNLTEATSSVLTITGGTGAVIGAGAAIQVKQASSVQSGYLSATDYNTFTAGLQNNSNIDGGTPSSVYGGAPIINGGSP